MDKANGTQMISRAWFFAFLLLAVVSSSLAVVVKGFHLFSDDKLEPLIQGADDAHYYMWLRSWVVDGDVSFVNDIMFTPFMDARSKISVMKQETTDTGLVPNKFPVGWAVVNLPVYAITHQIISSFDSDAKGFEPAYQVSIWVWQILLAASGVCFFYDLVRRWVPRRVALTAIMAVWCCSPMIYYQTARISMSHNSVLVLGILVLWLSFRIQDLLKEQNSRTSKLFLMTISAGFLAGLMVICRPSAIAYLAMPISVILAAMFSENLQWKNRCLMICAGVSGGIIGAFPQLFAWKQLYGKWIHYSYEGEGFNWGEPQFFESLFGDHHGLFNWHPFLLLGLVVLLLASVKKIFPRSWIISLLLITWANASWHMVYFGSAFGGRAYEFLVVYSGLGAAFLLTYLKPRQWLRNSVLCGYLVFGIWNTIFMYLFMQGLVSREEPVSWAERLSATGLF